MDLITHKLSQWYSYTVESSSIRINTDIEKILTFQRTTLRTRSEPIVFGRKPPPYPHSGGKFSNFLVIFWFHPFQLPNFPPTCKIPYNQNKFSKTNWFLCSFQFILSITTFSNRLYMFQSLTGFFNLSISSIGVTQSL